MIASLKGQFNDWKYGRGIVLKFLLELSDDDLDRKLPRKELNTIRLQIEELAQIQKCYVDALTAKTMGFKISPIEDKSKQSLVDIMAKLDGRLEKILETSDGSEEINWFGELRNIHGHISAMIGHEQMHIGQIVAFCYTTGIHIPNAITEEMALDG